MAYTITKSNGTPLAVVQDATLDTISTSLTIVGRDYAGYGEFLNENFVYLIENFAQDQKNTSDDTTSGPAHPMTGQLWYDTYAKILKIYTGTSWKHISSSIAKSTQPVSATSTVGDQWFDTVNYQLYIFTGDLIVGTNGWQLIGPPDVPTPGQKSGAVVENIVDSSTNNHVAIKFYIENNILAIMSYDTTYTPNTSIAGFPVINPGLNLISSDTLTNSQLTGSASNALTLNGITSNKFLRSDINTSTTHVITAQGGIVVGSGDDLTLSVDVTNQKVLLTGSTDNYDLDFIVKQSGVPTTAIGISASTGTVTIDDDARITGTLTTEGVFTANGQTILVDVTTVQAPIIPTNSGQTDLGNANVRFGNLWATTLYGNLIGGLTSLGSFTVTGNLTTNNTLSTGLFTSSGNIIATGHTTLNGNLFIANTYVPAANTAVGSKGQISYNASYFYVCVAANLWARAALTTSW
jgi:hypothetical protein